MKSARILIALAGALSLCSPGSAQSKPQAPATPDRAPAADSPELRSVRRLLDARVRAERPQADLVREIASIGPRVVPVLVGILTGALPGTDWEESGLTLEESRAAQSDENALLREALHTQPSTAVAQALTDLCGGTATIDRRLVGLHLLAEVGEGAPAVTCWRELAGGIEEIHLRRAYVRAQLENALARCLERSSATFEPLRHGLRDWEPRLLPALVHACADANRRPGIEVLSSLRGTSPELDLEVLHALPRLAASTRGALDELELSWLRGFLGDERAEVRSEALLGLGQACDPSTATLLVDGLADADERVSQAALWSLKHVSGLRLSASREVWQGWLESENSWNDRQRPRCVQALASKDSAAIVEALHELTRHPLFRHENARAVADLGASEDLDVLRAACSALRVFDSMAGADMLLGLLGRDDESLRALAHQTLVELSGEKLGPQPELWQALLGS